MRGERAKKSQRMDGWLMLSILVHGSMPKVQNSEHFPLPSETERNAGESMLMMWLLARPRPDKGPSIEDVFKNLGIFDPHLVRILTRPLVLNSRNLPYHVCFWANPPLVRRTSFTIGP